MNDTKAAPRDRNDPLSNKLLQMSDWTADAGMNSSLIATSLYRSSPFMMPFSSNVDGCKIWQYSYFGHNVYFRPHNEVILGERTREIQILPYMHIVSMTFYHDLSVKLFFGYITQVLHTYIIPCLPVDSLAHSAVLATASSFSGAVVAVFKRDV